MQNVDVTHDAPTGVGSKKLEDGSWVVVGCQVDAVTVGGTVIAADRSPEADVAGADTPKTTDAAARAATVVNERHAAIFRMIDSSLPETAGFAC
jgi:hypothetical protein